jgi:hypothetical protein
MWLSDPTANNKKSVTLTLLILCLCACLIAATFHMLGYIQHTSILLEMFWGILATYIGRRVNFQSKNFKVSSEKEREDK